MKNKTTAAILALFFGTFGIHRFYLKQNILGILYFLFCWTLIPTLISFIDFLILVLTSKEKFDSKYNSEKNVKKNTINSKQKIIEKKVENPEIQRQPKNIEIDANFADAENLLSGVKNIYTLEQSNNWDLRATKEIERIENLITKIQNAKKDYDNELNKLLKLPFFKGAKIIAEFQKNNKPFLKNYKSAIQYGNQLIENLDYWIALTPNSKEEIQNIIKDLRNRKQELNFKKRELNIGKKNVWSEYRQDNAKVEMFYSRKWGHYSRGLNMKYREANLKPINEQLNLISMEEIEIDKRINWLKNFRQK